MATALKARSRSLTKNAVLMIATGMAICALGTLMAKPIYEQSGYVIAAALTVSCLVIACISVNTRENGTYPRRLTNVYLMAGASSIICCLAFWLIQPASADLRLLGIVAGLHGLFWGAWYMKLAFEFQSNSIKQFTLVALAATTSSVGIIIATRTGLTKLSSVTAVGCYMIALGIQLYLTSGFLYREYARAVVIGRK